MNENWKRVNLAKPKTKPLAFPPSALSIFPYENVPGTAGR